ncbi:MAG: outer membrane beta-barrel protein [Ignavibacteriales bacterium]
MLKLIHRLILLLIILLVINSTTQAQHKLSISGTGNINYIPMKEFSNYVSTLSNSSVDKISFGGNIKFNYYLTDSHQLYLNAEYISTNASFSGGFASIKWIFQTIPISFGYEYSVNINSETWKFLLGGGILYSFFENTEKYSGDTGNDESIFKDSSFGFEVQMGVLRKVVENISIIMEIKYRYIEDYNLNSFNNFNEVNLSGIGLNVGVRLELI